MCHNVSARRSLQYYYLRNESTGKIYGLKSMFVDTLTEDKNVIRARFMTTKYDFKFKGDTIVVKDTPKIQPIQFTIPVSTELEQFYSTQICERKIKAGMHIYPFFYYNRETGDYRIYKDPFDVYIVMFRSDDIVFYDGKDISVKRFVIPSGSMIENDELLQKYLDKDIIKVFVNKHRRLFVELWNESN